MELKTKKRVFDLSMSIIAFLIASPIMAIISIYIYVIMGRPIIFKQVRPGLKGNPFPIRKFRTMTNENDKRGMLYPDEYRLTGVGKFLRSTSLDELPEILNVLKGEMSIVGPRPLLMKYLDRYNPEQFRRHEVKPGITGWAQVNGRNAISWDDKFKFDVWYVENMSFTLDLKIIALTIKKVLKREGITAQGEATMPEFDPQITQINAD